MLAKLNWYNYSVLPGIIRIDVEATNDPVIVDIMSDIQNSDGNIYLEGHYYLFTGEWRIDADKDSIYLELNVVLS